MILNNNKHFTTHATTPVDGITQQYAQLRGSCHASLWSQWAHVNTGNHPVQYMMQTHSIHTTTGKIILVTSKHKLTMACKWVDTSLPTYLPNTYQKQQICPINQFFTNLTASHSPNPPLHMLTYSWVLSLSLAMIPRRNLRKPWVNNLSNPPHTCSTACSSSCQSLKAKTHPPQPTLTHLTTAIPFLPLPTPASSNPICS